MTDISIPKGFTRFPKPTQEVEVLTKNGYIVTLTASHIDWNSTEIVAFRVVE